MKRIMTAEERLRCAAAHVAAVRAMVERGVPCGELVRQIRAVDGALQAVAHLLVQQEVRRIVWTVPTEAGPSDVRALFGALRGDDGSVPGARTASGPSGGR